MKTFNIEAAKLKEFATALKAVEPMENIRKAFVKQPDGSANYYAVSKNEIEICSNFGIPD